MNGKWFRAILSEMLLRSLLLILLTLFYAITAGNAKDPPDLQVKFSKGRLSASATDTPLQELLQEIGKRAKFKVEVRDPDAGNKETTVSIDNRPLGEALARILQPYNYLLSFDGKRLAGVVILSRKEVSQQESIAAPLPKTFEAPPSPKRAEVAPVRQEKESALEFAELLERNPDQGFAAIAKALKSDLPETRLTALQVLGSSDDRRALPLIGEALADPDSEVKTAALGVISQKDSSEVIQILTGALNDPDPTFQLLVFDALTAKQEELQALTSPP